MIAPVLLCCGWRAAAPGRSCSAPRTSRCTPAPAPEGTHCQGGGRLPRIGSGGKCLYFSMLITKQKYESKILQKIVNFNYPLIQKPRENEALRPSRTADCVFVINQALSLRALHEILTHSKSQQEVTLIELNLLTC